MDLEQASRSRLADFPGADEIESLSVGDPAPARLDELVMAQVALSPHKPAIQWRGEIFDYRWLGTYSGDLVRQMREAGIDAEDRVAVALERSPDLIAAMLAVQRIGATCVPLDSKTPGDRLAYILADSGCTLVIAHAGLPVRTDFTGKVLRLDWPPPQNPQAPDPANICIPIDEPGCGDARRSAHSPALIIYTSGSTGLPKGVLLSHSAAGFIRSSIARFSDGQMERVAAVTSIAFDPAIFEIFGTLAAGGMLILKESGLEPFLPDERPTLFENVPSVVRQLARKGAIPSSVRVINCGGERLTADVARLIHRATEIEALYNNYGPTETSICATVAAVPPDIEADPPVGYPVAGARISIRDEKGRILAPLEHGEIHIGGPGLALGYLNGDAGDSSSFKIDHETGERLYATGDIGFLDRDGALHFVGRRDSQVKLRGHRIELAEIDDALIRTGKVSDAAAVLVERPGAGSLIVAFVVSESEWSARELRNALATMLPAYMVPQAIIGIGVVPRMVSDKVDRASLAQRYADLATGQARAAGSESAANDGVFEPHAAPAKITLQAVRSILARSLERDDFGPDENFLEAGGDSLMAVDLAMKLEALSGRALPANLLLHAQTPRAIVQHLGDDPDTGLASELLRPVNQSVGPVLFLMPGVRGGHGDYLSLIRHLGDFRLVSVHSTPLASALAEKPVISTLAEPIAEAIAKDSPQGIITLMGYSFGGLVGHEVAALLVAAGREVRLVLIDPRLQRTVTQFRDWLAWLRAQVVPSVRDQGIYLATRTLVRSLLFWKPASIGRVTASRLPDNLRGPEEAISRDLVKAHGAIRPRPNTCRTLFIYATRRRDDEHFLNPDSLGGCRDLLRGDVQIESFDCCHGDLIYDPQVERVAQLVRTWSSDRPRPTGGASL